EARHRRQQRADDDADFASLPPLILPPDKDQFFADARATLEADEFNTFPIQNVLPLVVCWVVGLLLKKYNRTSVLVFILAFTIGLSAMCMGYVGAMTAWRDFIKGGDLGFSSVCAAEP
ncbi:hypothetical protein DYB30_011317, partial [Aphanomyces astaci]